MASNFLSNVLYRVSAGFIFLEKKAIGCYVPSMYCWSTDCGIRGVCHETGGGIWFRMNEKCGFSKTCLCSIEGREGLKGADLSLGCVSS